MKLLGGISRLGEGCGPPCFFTLATFAFAFAFAAGRFMDLRFPSTSPVFVASGMETGEERALRAHFTPFRHPFNQNFGEQPVQKPAVSGENRPDTRCGATFKLPKRRFSCCSSILEPIRPYVHRFPWIFY